MLVRCETEECENYNIPIENNIDNRGNYKINHNQICPKCKKLREKIIETSNTSIGIDEIKLGTKRMYENKVTKYQ